MTVPAPVRDAVRIRPLSRRDRDAVRTIFSDTLALGQPLPFPLDLADRYRDLCLGWYLDEAASDAAVAVRDGWVIGYALVCTDPAAHARWVRAATGRLARDVAALAVRGRLSSASRRFYGLRLRDGLTLLRSDVHVAAHGHLNIVAGERSGHAAAALRDHIDDRCEAAGVPRWAGEVNAPVGRRAASLERLGFEIVRRDPNRTATWLAGEPVERLTTLRRCGS